MENPFIKEPTQYPYTEAEINKQFMKWANDKPLAWEMLANYYIKGSQDKTQWIHA